MKTDKQLLNDVKKTAQDGKFTGHHCKTGFHTYCMGYDKDNEGIKYRCNCPCHIFNDYHVGRE